MRLFRWIVVSLLLVPPGAAFAQAPGNVDVNELAKTVERLAQENADLKKRVTELEARVSDKAAPEPAPVAQEAPSAGPTATATEPPAAAPASTEDGKTPLKTYWREGLHFESEDGNFALKVGGRLMLDVATFHHPRYWELGGRDIEEADGVELRETRLSLSGTLYGDYLYALEVDFAGDETAVKDAYLGMKNVPFFGYVQAGHFTEPFGLEQLTTSNHTTFMERSMVTEAIAPYRALGLGFTAPFFNERMTWAAGVFNRVVDEERPYWDVATRVTGLPWYADQGRRLLHVGASYMRQAPNGDISLGSHPESHLGNLHMDTGNFPADKVDRWAFETALVLGPFSLQAEYMAAQAGLMPPHRTLTLIDLDRHFASARRFDGYYVQAGVFLTGENRPYNTAGAYFDRIIPRHNFSLGKGGWGAWELAMRYSNLLLNDYDVRSGIIGGKGENWTAGLNWYMTPNTRLMINYVKAHVSQYAYNGTLDIFEGRMQIDF